MATAAPFVKLLRQLSSAKDEYRSGALDIAWDGGKATLFFVFGQPNHATYEAENGDQFEGQEALGALLHNLPRKFTVANWRKGVVRNESLKMSVDELMEPFAQLAGASSPDEESDMHASLRQAEGNEIGTGFDVDFDFSLEDFPLLPLGDSMWSDAAVNVVHLDLLVPKLPASLIVLTGPKLRAAALILQGQIIDAVWVDETERAAGEGAAMALMGAREGTVSCYRIENPRLVEALTMLWRCPPRYRDISTAWLDTDRFLHSLLQERRDCVIRFEGPLTACAFFMNGEYVAAYTSEDRNPTDSLDLMRSLIDSGQGTITILQRAADRALGKGVSEEAYHAVMAADTTVPAPSFADASAMATEAPVEVIPEAPPWEAPAAEFEAPVAEPEAPAWEAPAAYEPEVAADAPFEAPVDDVFAAAPANPWDDEAAAAPAEPDVTPFADEDAAPEEPVAAGNDDEAAIAADFFGVAPEALSAEPAPAEAPSWFGAATEEAPQEPAAEAPVPWSLDAPLPDTSAVVETWAGGVPNEEGQLAEEAAPVFDQPAAEEAPPIPFFSGLSVEPSNGTMDVPAEAEPAASAPPVLFGDVTPPPPADVIGATQEVAGENYDEPRLDMDFDGIKKDLIQIGVLWLGSDDVAPVAELIQNTRPSVDDFVQTIDRIKSISVSGHDPSVIRAMAREMHYHAAEYLSGA